MEGPNKRVKVSDLASCESSIIINTPWTLLYESIVKPIESNEDSLEQIALECFSINLPLSPADVLKLKGLIHATRLKYNDVMYHSFKHGLHVLVNCAKLLYEHQKYTSDNNNNNKFTQIQIYATIFAALIHDIEHLGVFNSTLITNKHELAILYNDQSVAEMRSLNVGLTYLCDFDILNNLSENEFKDFRKLVIDLVLSTDIVDHIRVLYYNYNNTTKKSYVGSLMTILKLSDVGSSTQHKNSSFTWTQRFYDEQLMAHKNYNQSRLHPSKVFTIIYFTYTKKKFLRNGIDNFYMNQVEYLEQHVYDLTLKIKALAADNLISVELADEIFLNLNNNIDVWKNIGGELCDNWKQLI